MQGAKMKVLRVWINGQSDTDLKASPPAPVVCLLIGDPTVGGQGTTITPFPDVEPSSICNGVQSCYDPTILNNIDQLMIDAHSYGIKVRIHKRNSRDECLTG